MLSWLAGLHSGLRVSQSRLMPTLSRSEKSRMVAGHGKNVRRWQRVLCGVRVLTYPYAARFDANDFSIERARISPAAMRFSMSGRTSISGWRQIRFAMNQGHARASAKQIQGGFGCGILRANHNNILPPIRVRIGEVVGDTKVKSSPGTFEGDWGNRNSRWRR